MPLENDAQAAISWAISLGYPMENMPNEDVLKSIFKSRQGILFVNMIKKVQPRQLVTEIRQNILVNRMNNIKYQIIPMCNRSFLPHEMQRYIKIQDLQKEKNEYEVQFKEAKEKCNPDMINGKNLQKMKITNICDTLRTKLNILELKLDLLTENVYKEIKIAEEIESIIPVKLTKLNSNEKLGMKAVMDALKELEFFYSISTTNSNSELLKDAKVELWLKLKKIFLKIPNSILWNIILRLKEEQIQNIKKLNDENFKEFNRKSLKDNNITKFDIHMMKLKSSIIVMIHKYLSVKKESNHINNKFEMIYKQFVDGLKYKINCNNAEIALQLSENDIDEIISDYVAEYSKCKFNNARTDFLNNEIDRVKKISDDKQRQIGDHEILISSLKHIYSDIMITVQRVQGEIKQLTKIKGKILYTKSLLEYTLKDIQSTHKQNKNKLSTSGCSMGIESFNISDNVLCSTKLDFDSTTNSNLTIRGDNTMISIQNLGLTPVLSSNDLELTIFMQTPLSKLHIMSNECWPYLLPNPLVIDSNSSISSFQCCPGVLLTVDGSIKYIKNKIDWYKKIKEISNEVKNDLSLIEVNQIDFKSKIKQQREDLIETLDKIDALAITTNLTLHKAEKYYEFLLNNPLKNYIPRSKLLNNQTYFDYEAEYSMYYRMATTGVSIQE